MDASTHAPAERQAMLAGALLSCVGLASFLLMPTLVEAAVSDLHYTERQVGILSAALSAGQTLSGLLSALWIRRSPWPRAAAITLVGLVVANGAALVAHDFVAFVALQALVGFHRRSAGDLKRSLIERGAAGAAQRPSDDFLFVFEEIKADRIGKAGPDSVGAIGA